MPSLMGHSFRYPGGGGLGLLCLSCNKLDSTITEVPAGGFVSSSSMTTTQASQPASQLTCRTSPSPPDRELFAITILHARYRRHTTRRTTLAAPVPYSPFFLLFRPSRQPDSIRVVRWDYEVSSGVNVNLAYIVLRTCRPFRGCVLSPVETVCFVLDSQILSGLGHERSPRASSAEIRGTCRDDRVPNLRVPWSLRRPAPWRRTAGAGEVGEGSLTSSGGGGRYGVTQ